MSVSADEQELTPTRMQVRAGFLFLKTVKFAAIPCGHPIGNN